MFDFLFSQPFGLFVTDQKIQVIQLKKNRSSLSLSGAGEKELPPGAIDQGVLRQPEVFEEALRGLLSNAQPNAIRGKQCFVTMPESKSFTHLFEYPKNFEGEVLKQVLDADIHQTFPLPPEDLIYDYQSRMSEEKQLIFVQAFERSFLESFRQFLSVIPLQPLAFEAESVSFLRSFPLDLDHYPETLVIYCAEGQSAWTLLWGGLILDNYLFPSPLSATETAWTSEVKKAATFFQQKTGHDFQRIALLGDPNLCASITPLLSPVFSGSIVTLAPYFSLPFASAEVVLGASLKILVS